MEKPFEAMNQQQSPLTGSCCEAPTLSVPKVQAPLPVRYGYPRINLPTLGIRYLGSLLEELTSLIRHATTALQNYSNSPSLVGDLKVFNDDHRYEGLVLVSTSFQEHYQQCQQVAVYSGNLELLNQICCELEEAQNSSMVLEPIECMLDQIQVYKQGNPSVDVEQIISLIKEFIDRRQPSIISNSRTSSTEAVAGSAPLSQGSSGITDMYSSDIEPQPMSVHFMENSQDLNESVQVYGEVNADLVSPDSGLATIRSNRSSKESSVFLSDDSPVAEVVSSYLNPVHGFPSFNPVCECETTQEQKPLSVSKNENYDMFSFDPLHNSNVPSVTSDADFSFANDFLIFQPLDIQAQTQLDDRVTQSQLEKDMPTLSADGEARLVEFYDGSVHQVANEDKIALEDQFSTEYAPAELISNPIGDNMDRKVPRTPMNSLVECSPLDDGLPAFFPEDVIEKISEMGNKDYALASFCQPKMWNDFEVDAKQTTSETEGIWNAHEQSPDLIMEYNRTSQVKSMCPDQPENIIKEYNSFLQGDTDMKQTVISPNSEDECLWHGPFSQTVLKSTDTLDQHAVESHNTVQYDNKTKEILDDIRQGKMLTQQDENTSPLDMWDNAVLNKKERTQLQDSSDETRLNLSGKGLENNGPEEIGIETSTATGSEIRNSSLNDLLCTTSNADLFPSMENVQSTAFRLEGDNWFNNQNVHYRQEKQDVACFIMDHNTLTDQPTSVNTQVITILYQGETESDVSRSDFSPLTPDMKNVTAVETHLAVTEKSSKGGPVISEEDREILSNNPVLCSDGVLESKPLFSEDIFPAAENTQSGYSEAWNSPVESPATVFEDTFSTTDVLDMQERKMDDNPAFLASQYTSIILDDKQKHPIEENLYSNNPFPQESHHAETYNWNTSLFSSDLWIPGMLGDIQLTPPEEEKIFKPEAPETSYDKANVELMKEGQQTPEISEKGLLPTKEESCETDMWSSLVEKDHQKISNSAIPESIPIWNTTIRDDTRSCDTSPGTDDSSESSEMWNALGQRGSLVNPLQVMQESMDMWNTTIQEDSQPSETTPEERGSSGNLELWGTSTENLFQTDVDYFESSEIGPAESICSANEDGDFNEELKNQMFGVEQNQTTIK
ncbi:protein prune homolog 2-like [Polyodon spathula]|uniref:protein prune homolog 2-like n=1 Tax=Polyodon spathula TaxID=7913 RepID=UPI001B7F2DF6|nr:protein prune homolog 2-like [Polyodon spathula]